jgi:hypothetical protein
MCPLQIIYELRHHPSTIAVPSCTIPVPSLFHPCTIPDRVSPPPEQRAAVIELYTVHRSMTRRVLRFL